METSNEFWERMELQWARINAREEIAAIKHAAAMKDIAERMNKVANKKKGA